MTELILEDQPRAERALRAALARPAPPQQLLFFGPRGCGKRAAAREVAWRIMDPRGLHDRRAAAVDLIEVSATGAQIRLEELDPALAAIAARLKGASGQDRGEIFVRLPIDDGRVVTLRLPDTYPTGIEALRALKTAPGVARVDHEAA